MRDQVGELPIVKTLRVGQIHTTLKLRDWLVRYPHDPARLNPYAQMKNYENCPVNEWNSDGIQMSAETYWPWDVVVPRSSGTRESAAVTANEDSYSSGSRWEKLQSKLVDSRATV